MKRTGTLDAPTRKTPEQRFWAKVDRRGPNECWLWTGALNEHGYGMFNAEGRHCGPAVRAHRFVLGLLDPRFAQLIVRHSCDNPPRVNPAHLSTGSMKDNSADMVTRDRHARGSRCAQAKLTEPEVAEILRRVALGELHRALAEEFGVSRSTISRITARKGWKHVAALVEAITGEELDRYAA